MPKCLQVGMRIPAVHEDRVRPPSLYFVNESRIFYAAKMMTAGSVGHVANELVSVAIEQRDVPLNVGSESRVELRACGGLR